MGGPNLWVFSYFVEGTIRIDILTFERLKKDKVEAPKTSSVYSMQTNDDTLAGDLQRFAISSKT